MGSNLVSLPPGISIRPLTEAEFPLASGPEGVIWPRGSILIGAWRGEKLVGRIGVLVLPHIEGLHVDESERESFGSIARALHQAVESASMELGRPAVFAYVPADKSGMGAYLQRDGYKRIEMELWGKALGTEEE